MRCLIVITLKLFHKKDIKIVIRIINHFDEKDICYAADFFAAYFRPQSTEHRLGKIFPIRIGGEIAGVIGYARSTGEGLYELTWMYVDEKHHGKGVGSRALAMIESIIRKKKKGQQARLMWVQTGHPKARWFYKKNGFALDGEINDFYRDGSSNWYLSKRLRR